MASQATIQTLMSFDVKVLHLESSDICQASCPSCGREVDPVFDKNAHNNLTVDKIKSLFDESFIKNLDKMFMCGDYGDPAANKHSLDIYKHFRNINDNIVLGMNTNGAIQNVDWWQSLAKILHKEKDYVIFSIDGLEDTNHIYRRGVQWDKLMENANAFIQAGGKAHWDMLVYEHNEHQVEACENTARSMGFYSFNAKVSKRIPNVTWLKQPKGWINPVVSEGQIECFAENEQSIYVTASGSLRPCCWHGFTYGELLEAYPALRNSWNTPGCNEICKRTCTKQNEKTSFTNQWQRRTVLC